MTQLWELGAAELAPRVRAGEVSAREVVSAHLARIAAVDPAVTAVTEVLAGPALRAADEVDRGVRSGGAGRPLCGVPMTIKANVDVAGSATTLGTVALRSAAAAEDAPHVAALRAAGAIPIARTNMPEFGMRWHTDNNLCGATRNPWAASVTPGGSSGGDAVAVSTGMAPIGLGNDGAGSLRWPAQCCGVAALKPSLGRVGGRGGPVPFAFQLLAAHGPIARSVDDLRLVYETICAHAHAAGDPWYAPVPLSGPPLPRRVHAVLDLDGIEAPVAAALRTAAHRLEDAGYDVLVGTPPALDRAAELFVQVMSAYGRVDEHQPPVETVAGADFVHFWAAFEPAWAAAAGPAAFDPMMERAAITRAWHDWLVAAPLVLTPVRTGPAFRVGADLDPAWLAQFPASMRTAWAVNLLGLPAVAVPVEVTGGLPQGVQLIGPRFREDLCLDAAAVVAARLTPISPRA